PGTARTSAREVGAPQGRAAAEEATDRTPVNVVARRATIGRETRVATAGLPPIVAATAIVGTRAADAIAAAAPRASRTGLETTVETTAAAGQNVIEVLPAVVRGSTPL